MTWPLDPAAPPPPDALIWKGRELRTIGELTDAIAALESREEAQRFIAAYRAVSEHADVNAGYVTGYLGPQRANELREWMGTPHPISGMKSHTPEQAVQAGKRWARGEFDR